MFPAGMLDYFEIVKLLSSMQKVELRLSWKRIQPYQVISLIVIIISVMAFMIGKSSMIILFAVVYLI